LALDFLSFGSNVATPILASFPQPSTAKRVIDIVPDDLSTEEVKVASILIMLVLSKDLNIKIMKET